MSLRLSCSEWPRLTFPNDRSKIKELNYEFPSTAEVSVEATNLIEQILTTAPGIFLSDSRDSFHRLRFQLTDKRPTLTEILQHPFFSCGPFPASIPPTAMDSTPDFRNVSIRASHRNFVAAKKECGISEDQPVVIAKVVLPPVVEETEVVQSKRRDSGGASRGMEKEVREVLQPNSPISELLRYVILYAFLSHY